MTVSNCALCLLSCFGDGYETRFLIPHSYFTSSPPPILLCNDLVEIQSGDSVCVVR